MRRRFRPSVTSVVRRTTEEQASDTSSEASLVTSENVPGSLAHRGTPTDSSSKNDQEISNPSTTSSQTCTVDNTSSSSRRRTRIRPSVIIKTPASSSSTNIPVKNVSVRDKNLLSTQNKPCDIQGKSSEVCEIGAVGDVVDATDVVDMSTKDTMPLCVDGTDKQPTSTYTNRTEPTGNPNQITNDSSESDIVMITDDNNSRNNVDSLCAVESEREVGDVGPEKEVEVSHRNVESVSNTEELQTEPLSESRTLPQNKGTAINSGAESSALTDNANKKRPNVEPSTQSGGRRSKIKPVIKQRTPNVVGRKNISFDVTRDQETLQNDSLIRAEKRTRTEGEVTPLSQTTESPPCQPVAETSLCVADSTSTSSSSSSQLSTSHQPALLTPTTTEATIESPVNVVTTNHGRRRRATPNLSSLSRRRSHLASLSEDESLQSDTEANKRPCQDVIQSDASDRPSECSSMTGKGVTVLDVENVDNTESRKRKAPESGHSDTIAVDGTDNAPNNKKESTSVKRRSVAPKIRVGKDGVDPRKMTMFDLIYYNPKDNPLRSSVEEKEKRKKQTEEGEGDSPESVVGSPTRNSLGSPPRPGHESPPGSVTVSPSIPAVDTDSIQQQSSVSAEINAEDTSQSTPSSESTSIAPQVKIAADGSIVLDEESLTIQRPPDEITLEDGEVVYEDSNTVPFNSTRKRTKSKIWQMEETLKFYKVLSQIGTDFSLMALMFPKRTRTELKRKFKREEKSNRALIDKALDAQVPIDEELFKQMDGGEDEETIAGLVTNNENEETNNSHISPN